MTKLIPRLPTRKDYLKSRKTWVKVIKETTKNKKVVVCDENNKVFYVDIDDILSYEEYIAQYSKTKTL